MKLTRRTTAKQIARAIREDLKSRGIRQTGLKVKLIGPIRGGWNRLDSTFYAIDVSVPLNDQGTSFLSGPLAEILSGAVATGRGQSDGRDHYHFAYWTHRSAKKRRRRGRTPKARLMRE